MPQKRHTVDLVVAKLRKADLEVCKALTHSGPASAAAGLMWTGVRGWCCMRRQLGCIAFDGLVIKFRN